MRPRAGTRFRREDAVALTQRQEEVLRRVWPGIWLPAEFNEAANAAMGR